MLDPTLLEFKCTGKCRHLQVFPIKAISQGIFSTAFGSHLHCLGLRSRTYLKATVRAPNRSHAFTGGAGHLHHHKLGQWMGVPARKWPRSLRHRSFYDLRILEQRQRFLKIFWYFRDRMYTERPPDMAKLLSGAIRLLAEKVIWRCDTAPWAINIVF